MNSTKVVHIIGIGGIGMSAIAKILYNLNYKVQGSDAYSNDNIDRLKKLGIEVYTGHSADNINQAQIVVYSSAIQDSNVELIAARENNKVIIHRSDILTELMKNKYTIAVSGSSGKTTTTAMLASIFDHSNIDPTVIVGGILNSYQSNAKFSKGDIFLLEADESDGTMLKIHANIAVITTINSDHIDYYGTVDGIKRAFCQFIDQADCAILPDFVDINYNEDKVQTFGFKGANIRAVNVKQHADIIEFDVLINANKVSILPSFEMKNVILSNAIGIHKVSNALAAISVAIKLGINEENIRNGLLEFKGVKRRFSTIADIEGVKFIEDYAHHPDEIHATLIAARSIAEGKVVGIIEPLRFARIRNFFCEFINIFMMFDYVVITPVHPPEDELISGCSIDDIQKALISNGFNNVKTMNDSLSISRFINDFTNSGDIVLFIGAGGKIAKLAKEAVEFIIGVE
ncbi:Mur ligase, central,Mur ligase, C-terminal,Mur ligase, N-terminal catalytic domain,UDP-N-acetylmuramate-- [Cinara cedri]|uniref:UDP-N-acetylmuramate--L-alanine ligase n=1 Tax=Cinara cedri TaxID=506608 RepID=A0A5E4NMY3_9HEMI|nr:Mur ligase, central,Mur ligase, C-terminal,Mur ligase, N-terminal catalytic domain,UDP-N-acetylmuramate-- [Cinara cedri]